jgi:Uma2 family endonuclease
VTEYWIVNLLDQVLEVYREPAPDPAAAFGWRYRSLSTFGRESAVSPLAAAAQIRVADLLP